MPEVQKLQDGDRHFPQTVGVLIRRARTDQLEAGRSIDGQNARIVAEAEIAEHVDRPTYIGFDSKIGSSKAVYGSARDVLQHAHRSGHVVAELARQVLRQMAVRMTVTADLVAGGGDAANQGGIT